MSVLHLQTHPILQTAHPRRRFRFRHDPAIRIVLLLLLLVLRMLSLLKLLMIFWSRSDGEEGFEWRRMYRLAGDGIVLFSRRSRFGIEEEAFVY
jgi:hypothetical protein